MTEPVADPLVIRGLEFLGPMVLEGGWRPDPAGPEIAFAGRSNVGKSSLLNKLVRRKAFARVSNTPGRTRQINFFAVNGRFVMVDLPGYGYAKISKTRRAEWVPLIEGYLRNSRELRGIVLLLDARRDPSEEDMQMLELLAEIGAPTVIAATKVDKLKAKERQARLAALGEALGMSQEQIVPFSAVTGEGRDDLATAIVGLVEEPSWRGE